MHTNRPLPSLFYLLTFFFSIPAMGQVLDVGIGKPFATITEAAQFAMPGDTILVHPGNHAGGMFIDKLQGTPGAWITIRGVGPTPVSIVGGANAIQFSDPAYLRLENLLFAQQTGNGLNVDDGGSYETPAIHLEIVRCVFEDIAATGNNDLLKMSGVDSFLIADCLFRNGSAGGSGMDMVGCHWGLIRGNRFANLGSNSIQAKGGTRWVTIHGNSFINGGQRTLNLGGSTGPAFFRPPGADYEAADLEVYANIIQGSWAALAFVGSQRVKVWNNTIHLPQNWVMRILQETADTSFYQAAAYGEFVNNIVVVGSSLSTVANVGPNTNAGSFLFSNNLWLDKDNPGWAGPVLPALQTASILQQDPLFQNVNSADFRLLPGSPAIGTGKPIPSPDWKDHDGNPFISPPSRGAFEGGLMTFISKKAPPLSIRISPNPAKEFVEVEGIELQLVQLFDLAGRQGKALQHHGRHVDLSAVAPGIYWLALQGVQAACILPLVIEP